MLKCSLCNKPIEASLTGWILNRDNCVCATPVPDMPASDAPLSAAPVSALQPSAGGQMQSLEALPPTPLEKISQEHQQTILNPGVVVVGRYKILDVLGNGAMGSVYLIEQIHLQKRLAMKVLDPKIATGTNLTHRFQNEALAVSKLEHANIVRALDYGWLENGQPFLVLELIEGETLAQRLKREGRLSPDDALNIFIPVCLALSYAHHKGVVHRDLKPSNIMLTGLPHGQTGARSIQEPKIVDFGIAKLVDGGGEGALTQTGEVFGTPFYMSPEQCLGGNVDLRSDIYSLGCVLYESLTSSPPFSGRPLQMMMQHKEATPPALKDASLGFQFSPDLEHVVMKMLAKLPADRYQDCSEVAEDLFAIQKGKRISGNKRFSPPLKSGDKSRFHFLLQVTSVLLALLITSGGVWLTWFANKKTALDMMASKARDASKVSNIGAPLNPRDNDESLQTVKNSGAVGSQPLKLAAALVSHLQFPNNESIGDINWKVRMGDREMSGSSKAEGLIDVPYGAELALRAGMPMCDYPEYFRLLASMPITNLTLKKNLPWTNKHIAELRSLAAAGRLGNLRYLCIADCSDLNDECIDDLGKLSSVRYLVLSDTAITGTGLARLENLSHIQVLTAHGLSKIHDLLPVLVQSAALTELYVDDCDLSDRDLKKIGHISSLRLLRLDGNKKISNAGLPFLRELPQLHELGVPFTAVTPASLGTFKTFSALKILHVGDDFWTAAEKALFEQKLKIKVIIERNKNVRSLNPK